MPRVKNQHYVPQFYLKGFSADGKNIFVFDKVAKKSFKTGVANIGSEQLFYELPPGPSGSDDSQVVEKAFSVLEAGYSNAVQELLSEVELRGRFTPGPSERNLGVAHFLAMQFCRTREFRDTHARMLEQLGNVIANKHEFARQHMAAQGEVIEVEPPLKPATGEMVPLQHADFIFNGSFVERVMPVLLGHIWLIAQNDTSQPLFTSDAPVILYPHVSHPLYGGSGFASRGVEILFPLSSRYVLVLRERSYFATLGGATDGTLLRLRLESVAFYNGFQICESYRQIYSSEDRFDQVRELIEQFPAICDRERPRFSVLG